MTKSNDVEPATDEEREQWARGEAYVAVPGHAYRRYVQPLLARIDAEKARADLADKRLLLARDALIADGYFKPGEVGDDIAPRIVELRSRLHSMAGTWCDRFSRAMRAMNRCWNLEGGQCLEFYDRIRP